MRAAEQNLDAFRAAVDESISANVKYGLHGTALQQLLAQPRALQRTPGWVEPEKMGKTEDNVSLLLKPLSELFFEREQRTESTVDRTSTAVAASSKVKTRGTPAPGSTEANGNAAPAPPPPAVDIQPTFHLDARALKAFRTLFYAPSIDATPGVVAWTDFLHAMVSTGFVPEKLYGSVAVSADKVG